MYGIFQLLQILDSNYSFILIECRFWINICRGIKDGPKGIFFIIENLASATSASTKTSATCTPSQIVYPLLEVWLVYDYYSFKLQFPFDKLVLTATTFRCKSFADQLAGTSRARRAAQ